MINAFFLTEQEDIKKEIDKLETDREKIKTAANNWRDKANDIFIFARYAKEDFDSNNMEWKRAVIKRLGTDLKLSNRTIQFTLLNTSFLSKNNILNYNNNLSLLEPTQNRRKKASKKA